MANKKSSKTKKPFTAQDGKRQIEAEKKKDPAAFKKKYGGKPPVIE